MKKAFVYLSLAMSMVLASCIGPQGMSGEPGYSAEAEVFELRNINFDYNAVDGYTIYRSLNPNIYASDNILIYRMTSTINQQTPVWQSIPRTFFWATGKSWITTLIFRNKILPSMPAEILIWLPCRCTSPTKPLEL